MTRATSASEAPDQAGTSLSRSQRVILFAAWLHLLLPAFILGDIVTSRFQGEIRFSLINGAVTGLCALWLGAGLLVLAIFLAIFLL